MFYVVVWVLDCVSVAVCYCTGLQWFSFGKAVKMNFGAIYMFSDSNL